jgi:competence protein ComEC
VNENRRKLNLLLVFFLISVNFFVWQALFNLGPNSPLKVIFFDVGQGDAIFIETPHGHQILIDGGSSLGDKTIDLVILTHPEKDHMAGLLKVLERYKVEQILWTGIVRNTADYNKWRELIEKEEAKITIAEASKRVKAGRVSFNILYPFESLEGEGFKNSNNTSIIAQLIFGNSSFLFTGDAGKSIERKILSRYKEDVINSDVLKVGHHGSKTSTSEEFLEKVSPEIAVISCGKNNPYNHPHQEVLKNLEKFGIETLRTDINGDIKISSFGKGLKIETKP